MQIIIYFFIGLVSALLNIASFQILFSAGFSIFTSVVIAFCAAALLNYLLCMAVLFRHKARWSTLGELGAYVVSVLGMCLLDYLCTFGFIALGLSPLWAKTLSSAIGFAGNFILRKYYVF